MDWRPFFVLLVLFVVDSLQLLCHKCLPSRQTAWCRDNFGPLEECWAADAVCLKVDILTLAGGVKKRVVIRQCISRQYLSEFDVDFGTLDAANGTECIRHKQRVIELVFHGNKKTAQLYETQERFEMANLVHYSNELFRAMDHGILTAHACICNDGSYCNAAPPREGGGHFRPFACALLVAVLVVARRHCFVRDRID